MAEVSIFTTPSGDRMAILALADYEKLLAAAEDASDRRLYDSAKRDLKSGEDEPVPAEFAKRLITGENPVRVWREIRGLRPSELAERVGVTVAYLGAIEAGRRDGALGLMRRIAEALKVKLNDLVSP